MMQQIQALLFLRTAQCTAGFHLLIECSITGIQMSWPTIRYGCRSIFFPGNGGMPAGENPEGSFIRKLVCHPDSHVARDMLRTCATDIKKPYALHRLGITMHVYADTWAHQGFAGVNHEINEVRELQTNNKSLDKSFITKIANFFLSESFPLGHGAALSHPDLPSLIWEYKNGLDKKGVKK